MEGKREKRGKKGEGENGREGQKEIYDTSQNIANNFIFVSFGFVLIPNTNGNH